MSTNNLIKQTDINEDSLISNSTSNSFTDSLIQDLSKIKNIFFINKNIEQKISDILSYLQSDSNLAVNKSIILKYLQSLFLKVNFNSVIFSRKFTNDKERLNIYQIIIYQYIFYTNSGNTKNEEENYRSDLQSLFILLLSQITMKRDTYHYILSFLINFVNQNNLSNAMSKKSNSSNINYIQDESIINLKPEHLTRILDLLRIFYKYSQSYNETPNYFFFSGDSDSNITIQNKENPRDHNKKFLNLDDTLCIMLFIKVLPSEYIKAVFPKLIFRLLELRFNDKNKKSININIDIDNNLTTSYTNKPLFQLLDSETNCILIKFNKKKKVINSEIYVGLNKIELPPIEDETDKEKGGKLKDEIKEIVLFKNFIGICTNIIIYKEKKFDGLPKFLISIEGSKPPKEEKSNSIKKTRRKSVFNIKSIFPNGIYDEELFSFFIRAELKDQIDQSILQNNFSTYNEKKINLNEFHEFLNNNLIAIYLPTRVDLPSQYKDRSLSSTPLLILRDSINNLDAEFSTKYPPLNGVHTYSKINEDFSKIDGINNILPIMEIMTNNLEFLTSENFSSYFKLLANYIFSPQYKNAIIKEDNSNFFVSLSYFLEKIPNKYFNEELIEDFKLILDFFISNNENDFVKLNNQFNNHILMNEKILFKFNENLQKTIINQVCLTAGQEYFEIDIIKLIKILLNYDKDKNYKFCCKKHAEYFKGDYPIMEPELSNRIEPIEKLFTIIFEKKISLQKKLKKKCNNNASNIKSQSKKNIIYSEENINENDNLYLLFYLLSVDISPCLKKSIIRLATNLIKTHTYNKFVTIIDKKEELFDIVLFAFKTSMFDVKVDSLNLLLLIEDNNKEKNLNDNNKKVFLKNEILPIFLLDEANNLQNSNNEKANKLDNTNKLENEENKEKETNKEIIQEKKDEEKKDEEKKGEQKKDEEKKGEEKKDEEKKDEQKKDEEKKDEQKNDDSNMNDNHEKKEENKINENEPNNTINIEEEVLKENVNINKINEDINNELYEKREELEKELNKEEIEEEENNIEYGIKTDVEIKGVKYSLFSPTDTQKKINKLFNKKHYYTLINDLYAKVIEYLKGNIFIDFKLNLLVDIVSKGDLLLFKFFVLKLDFILDCKNSENKENYKGCISKEISNNHNLLHWLIETAFQIYILKKIQKEKNIEKPFIPLFYKETYNNTNSSDELEENDKEINNLYDFIYKKCWKIINYILKCNLSKADYIFTWSKYYLELVEENSVYHYIKDFMNEFVQDLLNNPTITTFSEQDYLNNLKGKNTLYYFNLYFEFFTFYKLKYKDSFFKKDKIEIIKKLSNDFKYILLNDVEKGQKMDPIKELSDFDQKIDNYAFIKIVFSINSSIWSGNEKKLYKNENEIYSTYIVGNNKNTYLNELETLFYTFNNDYLKDIDNYCNKGIPLIIIIYHFFISFFNIGGTKNELNELFYDFRLFILLLIISSSTLNTAEAFKKKRWPKEEQYKEVQATVESILFNFLFYFYNKIKDYKNEINNYNTKIKNEENNTEKTEKYEVYKKNLECLLILERIYVENFGYFLKLLNKIYRGVKNDEKQKKSITNFFKIIFKSPAEGVKKAGPFLLFEKMYNESQNLLLNDSNNMNNLRKTMAETSKTYQIDENDLTNENNIENNIDKNEDRKRKMKNKSIRIGHKANNSTNLSNYATNPTPQMPSNVLDITAPKSSGNLDSKSLDDFHNENLNIQAEKELPNNLTFKKNININNSDEENYLDKICKINFCPKEIKDNKINITDKVFKDLENYINDFINDKNIEIFYEKYKEEYNKDLYSFISIIEKRQSMIKKIIPTYDNRKNLSLYPINKCLVPYYYPENEYKNLLVNIMEAKNIHLKKEIMLNQKKNELREYFKCKTYKNIKKNLFKFNGIWSNQEFFYDKEKYKLKYKLLNHLTNDFTRIFMTPIIDVNYYLPSFSKFIGNIFRNNNEDGIIPITKVIDLCFGKEYNEKSNLINNNEKNKENSKTDDKSVILTNTHQLSDSQNNSAVSIINEIKQENIIKQEIPLYENNQENYPFLKKGEKKKNENSNPKTNKEEYNEKDYYTFIEYIRRRHLKNKENCLYSEACLVRLDYHIRGIIYINNNEIGFYSYETNRDGNEEDFDNNRNACFGSVFKRKSEKYNQYYLKIPLKNIELIFKRRYYFKRNVLEIYNQDKKSYFFRIDENKFKSFLDILKNNLKNDLEDITIDYTTIEKKVGLINKNNILYNYNNYNILFKLRRISSLKNLYLKWIKWEISTFTLLNVLNIYSSRSYNDINQYPVFPWIITDYTSNILPNLDNTNIIKNVNTTNNNNNLLDTQENNAAIIRPFNTPIGMLDINEESRERKENFLNTWKDSEEDEDKDDNYDRYGSHYSTALNLTYYLVRVFPFSYIRIELQGNKFDDPNRLFNSLSSSFYCATTQKLDLRELIPEFFCLPEMFYNLNNLNLGEIDDNKTKKKKLVNDIEMPLWANGDAYIFVKKHRELLESVEISEKINEWFNIIFGSKQKGKAGKAIGNLFAKQTYDDFDEIHKNSDPDNKVYQKRMVEFGVTPSQIFKYDTSKRISVKDFKKKPILYNYQIKCGKKQDSGNQVEELEINDSDVYLEGNPYKIFSSLNKNEDIKNEKILFLYQDKIKIISKTNEKGFFKNIANKDNKSNKDNKNKENKSKDIKGNEEKKDNEIKENEEKDDNKINNENSDEENKSEEEIDKDDENTKNKETISKYDKILISPKYRMNISHAPTLIYDKGNYIAFGGLWNGIILINKLEEIGNKKDKSEKNISIISTNDFSPITHMKIDLSETFVICANKMGIIYIFIIDNSNKGEWILYKKLYDYQNEITSISINENLNIFAVSDKDGYINLYTLPVCKLFNSYKINDNILTNNITISNDNYSSSISNTLFYIPLNIHANHVIISHSPLPCLIVYIESRKSIIIFSINFHFIKEVILGYEIVPNGIKKYNDYFGKDYLFIYNQNEKVIEVYDIVEMNIIARSMRISHIFVDFDFCKEMDHALIMVRINEEKESENTRDKNEKRNYKILHLKSPGGGDIKLF